MAAVSPVGRNYRAEGAGRDALLGDGIGLIEGEDLDDGAGRAMGLLALEGTVLYDGQYRVSARSSVSSEMARDSPRSERGLGFRPSKPSARYWRSQRASVEELTVEREE